MKKIYSLILSTALGLLAFTGNTTAQITITSADMPMAGSKYTNGYDTLPSSVTRLNPGGSGANVTWNYATLPTSYRDTDAIVSVGSTPYAGSFPTATAADSVYGTPGYNYVIDSTTSFSIAGAVESVQGILDTAKFKPAILQLKFPANYGNTSGGSSIAAIPAFAFHYTPFDSAKATIVDTYADTIDAWGTLTTPLFGGTSYSTLRQKHYEKDIDSIFIHSSGGWQLYGAQVSKTYQYRWYANGIGDLVGLMSLDSTDKNVTSMEWYDGYPDAINEISQQHSTLVYPSPCNSQVSFKYSLLNAANIFVYDVTGREITRAEMNNGTISLNTSNYAPAMYLYNITDKSGRILDNGKFTVAR